MTDALDQLVAFWRQCPTHKPPFIHPQDRELIASGMTAEYGSFEEYCNSPSLGLADEKTFHVGLLPVPYVGDLRSASVFVLMLNPGLSEGDYFAEYDISGFKRVQVNTLYQQDLDPDFPFLFLNPKYSWHSGYQYWHGKFADLARKLAERHHVRYLEALSLISQQVAAVELVPYHSRSYGAGALVAKLPSALAIRRYVKEILVPRAIRHEAAIIVTRGARDWGVEQVDNIVVYSGVEARSAHLSASSRGGKAIAWRLGL